MKKLLFVLLVISLALLACSPAATSAPAVSIPTESPSESQVALIDVKVGYIGTGAPNSTVWYTFEKGFFEKHGLRVELIQLEGGTKGVGALISGDIDICQVGAAAPINAVAAGEAVVVIAGFYNTYTGGLYVKPEIKNSEDLKGKILATNQAGSAISAGTILILNQMGLVPDQDVTLLTLGSDSERLAALKAGEVDGTLLTPPAMYKAEDAGFVNLFDLASSGIPYQYIGLATTRSYISENRAVTVAFIQATIEAIAAMKADPEGAREVMAKYMDMDLLADAVLLDKSYKLITESLESDPYPTLPGIQTIIDSLIAINPDVASLTPDQVVDTTLLDEAHK